MTLPPKPSNYESRFMSRLDVPRPSGIKIIDEDYWRCSAKLHNSEFEYCSITLLNLANYLGLQISRSDYLTLDRLESDFEKSNMHFGMLLSLARVLSSHGADLKIEYERKTIVEAEELTDEVKRLLSVLIEDLTDNQNVEEVKEIQPSHIYEILDSKRIIVTLLDHNYLGRYAFSNGPIYHYVTLLGHKDDVIAFHDSQYWWGRNDLKIPGNNIRFVKVSDLLAAALIEPQKERCLLSLSKGSL